MIPWEQKKDVIAPKEDIEKEIYFAIQQAKDKQQEFLDRALEAPKPLGHDKKQFRNL